MAEQYTSITPTMPGIKAAADAAQVIHVAQTMPALDVSLEMEALAAQRYLLKHPYISDGGHPLPIEKMTDEQIQDAMQKYEGKWSPGQIRNGSTLSSKQLEKYNAILQMYEDSGKGKPAENLNKLHQALQELNDPVITERLLLHGAHLRTDQFLKTVLAWGKEAPNARFIMTGENGQQSTVDTLSMLTLGRPDTKDDDLNIRRRDIGAAMIIANTPRQQIPIETSQMVRH